MTSETDKRTNRQKDRKEEQKARKIDRLISRQTDGRKERQRQTSKSTGEEQTERYGRPIESVCLFLFTCMFFFQRKRTETETDGWMDG